MTETFLDEIGAAIRAGHLVWTALAWLVVAAIATGHGPAVRRRMSAPAVLLVLAILAMGTAAAVSADGYQPGPWLHVALAFELFAVIGIAQVALFTIALPRVGVVIPRILVDIATAVAGIVALIAVGKRAGWSVAGIVTTSAVLTAVIGFSLQDTLGNLMGGLALQADSSIKVGDWVNLGPGQPTGKVTEIRWRYTALETRNWETVIVPNSVLMKSQVTVLGRRAGQPLQLRRHLEFHVDFRTPPTEVIAAVLGELAIDPVPNMATEPPPHCLFFGIRDSFAVYAVRYWLLDLAADDGTDSAVRIRIYFALRRAQIALSMPAQAVFLTHESEERRVRKLDDERQRRRAALATVDLFGGLGEAERDRLADALRVEPFAAGEAVTHEGEHDEGLYLITRGEAVVQLGRGAAARTVARLGPGQFFGEMSLMTGAARSATIVAGTDLECYRIDKPVFQAIVAARPELAEQVAEILSARREELETARDARRAATSRAEEKADLLDRIRGFFGVQ